MWTINRVRVARLNPLIARDYEREGTPDEPEFPFWLRPTPVRRDPYTRSANICPACFTAKSTGTGVCFCD
jgi:hypothetical protein